MAEPRKEFTRKNFQALHEKGYTDVNIAAEFGITVLTASKARKRADFWDENGLPRKVEPVAKAETTEEDRPAQEEPTATEEGTPEEGKVEQKQPKTRGRKPKE